jgi:prevent-host-death family protein
VKAVNIHDAKTNFSKLVQKVEGGEEITISRSGVPVARLVPIRSGKPVRDLGAWRGKVVIADDFEAPLPDDVQAYFGGDMDDEDRPYGGGK